jgi:flagellar biosynthetic protein FliR
VIPIETADLLAAFAIFCRVGGCLLIAPGFSSSQIPARIRLFVALAVSLAVTPLLLAAVRPAVGDGAPATLFPLIFAELATGLLIGFIARVFFMALQTVTAFMTQAIGLSAIPGTLVGDDLEQVPALTAFFNLSATTLMFVLGLHIELMRGLIDSYTAIPPAGFAARIALVGVADQITAAFLVALRIASPFVIFSVVVNFALGVANKLTPLIPVFFIGMPFVLAGGLLLILITVREFLVLFEAAFADWLIYG